MPNDKDNVGGLVAGILIAAEQQRQKDEANRAAERAQRDLAEAEQRAAEERARAVKMARKAQEDYDDALDDLEDLRNLYQHLLSLPLKEIAARTKGSVFEKNYSDLMDDVGEWVVSQKAFKELSIELGQRLGLSLEDVLELAHERKQDVLSNRCAADNGSNASSHQYSRGKEDLIRARIGAKGRDNVKWYKARVADGTFYDILDRPPELPATMIKMWKQKAAQGVREAQLNLGIVYRLGYEVSRHFERAQDWLHKAHDQQDPKAFFELYSLYADPDNHRRDKEKARHFLDQAVAGGDQRAIAAVEAARQEEINQEAIRRRRAIERQWQDEEAGLLERLAVIREGEFPQELFDRIKERGYGWETELKELHTLTLVPKLSEPKNEGTLFRPNRQAWLSLVGTVKEGFVRNPGLTVYIWSDFYKKLQSAYCGVEKPGSFGMGKYPVGTVIDKLTLKLNVGSHKLTFIPRRPYVVK